MKPYFGKVVAQLPIIEFPEESFFNLIYVLDIEFFGLPFDF